MHHAANPPAKNVYKEERSVVTIKSEQWKSSGTQTSTPISSPFSPPAATPRAANSFLSPTHGPGKQKIYLQTPSLHCPFGVSTYKDEKTGQISNHIDVSLKDHLTDPKMKNFHGLMPAIDDVIVSMGVENSQDWFGKPLPEGTIREFHRPLVKQPKDPKYSPIMKIKIPVDKSGVPTAEIYNEAKERVSIDSIAKGSSITCIIELSPVWFVNKTFGLTWKLVQAAVTPGPQNFAGYSLLDEEEDW